MGCSVLPILLAVEVMGNAVTATVLDASGSRSIRLYSLKCEQQDRLSYLMKITGEDI
jgi:hypothetical protein